MRQKRFLSSFLLSFFCLFQLAAQQQELQPLPIDPQVRYGKLPNGLTYYIRHNEQPKERADFYIAQNVGSMLEEENQRGLAHFLEHMAFNGSKNFPDKGMDEFTQSIGMRMGENFNAYTSFDETVYMIMNAPVTRESVVDSCLLILHDWSGFITLADSAIDKERGVIREEWRTRQDAQARIWEQQLPKIYPDSRYAHRMPIGTIDVIDNFKPEPYWELKTIYRNTTFSATKGKFTKKEEGEAFLEKVKEQDFTVTSITEKKGKEFAPRLFDLTSLQVECNKKFAFTADDTLKLIQSLYEKKVTTYPRVDTTFLSDDIYPKVPNTLKGLVDYTELTAPLMNQKLPKSKKVFDNSKVTDHHAIIPTGVPARNLTDTERKVYDLVARRFIAAFYPDCEISTTTVLGQVDKVEFKVTGKQILKPGWRVVFGAEQKDPEAEPTEEEGVLPDFVKGESGPHKPILKETWTQPPKPYTEATLLRAMETAGKLVDNDELRDALKENGIGRPSTRAAIIETLFKRNYIRKERKNLYPTATGAELIGTIHEELLKSAELTGLWEKKLRQIERGTYEARTFLDELKQMVNEVVINVLSDQTRRTITIEDTSKAAKETPKDEPKEKKEKKPRKPRAKKEKEKAEATPELELPSTDKPVCPICHKGSILRGKTAYGCSEYKNGCTFRLDYATYGNNLTDEELGTVISKLKSI